MSDHPYTEARERYTRDAADHVMTVRHDDGLYRHLEFRHPDRHSWYLWHDIVTVPGALIFQGDGEAFVFRRINDMFEFFRQPAERPINPGYWCEKLVDGHGRTRRYDEQQMLAHIEEAVAEATRGGALPGLRDAVKRDVLDELCDDERHARQLVADFVHYEDDADRRRAGKRPDFEFEPDAHEWCVVGWDWWFLWACEAISHAVRAYDAHHAAILADAPAVTA